MKLLPTYKKWIIMGYEVKIYDGDSIVEKMCKKLGIKKFEFRTKYK